jgi:hypothetical protein
MPCVVSALQLVHTAFQSLGSLVTQAQPHRSCSEDAGSIDSGRAEQLKDLFLLQATARRYVVQVLQHVHSATSGRLCEPLLASPHLLPCIAYAAIVCAAMALAAPTQCKAQALAAASKNDTRTSKESSSCDPDGVPCRQEAIERFAGIPVYAEDAQHCWQLAGQLSVCQLKLFELLGVGASVILQAVMQSASMTSWCWCHWGTCCAHAASPGP